MENTHTPFYHFERQLVLAYRAGEEHHNIQLVKVYMLFNRFLTTLRQNNLDIGDVGQMLSDFINANIRLARVLIERGQNIHLDDTGHLIVAQGPGAFTDYRQMYARVRNMIARTRMISFDEPNIIRGYIENSSRVIYPPSPTTARVIESLSYTLINYATILIRKKCMNSWLDSYLSPGVWSIAGTIVSYSIG